MSGNIFSPYWYRVASLQPRLRAHARIDRQYLRNQLWYLLEDRSSGRQYRFTPAAHDILGAMDGNATVSQLWERAVARRGEEAPTQEEVLRILGLLHSLDLIQCEVTPDIRELFERWESHQHALTIQRWTNPLAVRVSLIDPDHLLDALLPLFRIAFSRGGFAVWLIAVCLAVISGAERWEELSASVVDRVLSPSNLLLISFIYPCLKLAHEIGHAAATKVWGGEVHDMGALFMALIPMPYVDCSAAAMFRYTHQRAIVGAAGMMVELFLAALAMLVWRSVEPGLLRACAYNVIFIAGISTVLVNGNPLLRFDAYYILADLIGIPNLGARAQRYLGYLCQRYLFGVQNLTAPVHARGERAWFVLYGIASFGYRTVVMVSLVWLVAGKYFFVGVLLALWAAATQMLLPLARVARFVLIAPALAAQRLRVLVVSAAIILMPVFLLFGVSLPLTTQVEGVVRMPEGTELRAGADATVTNVRTHDGEVVHEGDVLIESEDPFLGAQETLFVARAQEIRAKLTAAVDRRVEIALLKEQLASAEADLARVHEKQAGLILRAPDSGRVVIPNVNDLPGRFVKRGELIGYVLGATSPSVSVVVPQERIGLVRDHVEHVSLRTASRPDVAMRVLLQREVPSATDRLPSATLGRLGGGELATLPDDKEGLTLLKPAFQFDLDLPLDARSAHIGERVYVLFDHGREPLGMQWYRVLRQMFLGKFAV